MREQVNVVMVEVRKVHNGYVVEATYREPGFVKISWVYTTREHAIECAERLWSLNLN